VFSVPPSVFGRSSGTGESGEGEKHKKNCN
jgi:hypothetical protein